MPVCEPQHGQKLPTSALVHHLCWGLWGGSQQDAVPRKWSLQDAPQGARCCPVTIPDRHSQKWDCFSLLGSHSALSKGAVSNSPLSGSWICANHPLAAQCLEHQWNGKCLGMFLYFLGGRVVFLLPSFLSPPSTCWPLPNAAQDTINLLYCKGTQLAHVQPDVHQDPQVLFLLSCFPAVWHPACIGAWACSSPGAGLWISPCWTS